MKSKYVRPARLPSGAYDHMGGLNYYEQKKRNSKEQTQEKDYTRCQGIETQGSFNGDRCIRHVTERQKIYSLRVFKRILCFRHQAIERIKRR